MLPTASSKSTAVHHLSAACCSIRSPDRTIIGHVTNIHVRGWSHIHTLLPLAASMHRILGSDTKTLIKAIVVRHVHFQDDVPAGRAHAAAEGRQMTYLRRHSSLMLQRALSHCTRHQLCQQNVVYMEAARPRTNSEAAEAPSGPLLQQ